MAVGGRDPAFQAKINAQATTPVVHYVQSYAALGEQGVVISTGKDDPTNAQISLDITPTKGLSIVQNLPLVGASIRICSTGMTLAMLAPNAGPTIDLSATGIKVSVGGAAAALSLTPAGISLQTAGGAVSIGLNASGVTLTAGGASMKLLPAGTLSATAGTVSLNSSLTPIRIGNMVVTA
jgi:hypothetical protein